MLRSGGHRAALCTVLAAFVAIPAFTAAAANAAVYCVHVDLVDCGAEIDMGADLKGALQAASDSPENDTISIRPGTYGQSGVVYAPGNGQGGELHIVGSGAGPGGTVLKRADGNNATTLIVNGQAKTLVEDLAVEVPNGSTGSQNQGLRLGGPPLSAPATYVADNVTVTLPAIPTPGSGFLTGAHIQDATYRNGTVTGPNSDVVTGVSGARNAVLEDLTVNAYRGIFIGGGGIARRIDATAEKGFDLESNSPGTGFFTVEDSLWRPPPAAIGGTGLNATCGNVAGFVTVRNTTLVANSGTGTNAALSCSNGALNTRIDFESSILFGAAKTLELLGDGPLGARFAYSDFDPAKIVPLNLPEVELGLGNLNVPPGFIGGTDFRLRSDSPLLDKGDPSALLMGESVTDLGRLPRVVDATPPLCSAPSPRRDIGAYEYQPPPPSGTCPKPDSGTKPPTPSALDTKLDGSSSAKKTQKQKGRKIAIKVVVNAREALTAKATGKIKVGRKSYVLKTLTKKVTVGRATLTLKPKKAKHRRAIIAALKAGKKASARFTVKLTDAKGNRASKTFRVKLKR